MKWQDRHTCFFLHVKGKANCIIRKAYSPSIRGQFIWAWQVGWNEVQVRGWGTTKKEALAGAEKAVDELISHP